MIYTSKSLSNEDYHSGKYPQSSGSELWAMHSDCSAQFKLGEQKETKAMTDGTAIHCGMLETKRFNENYMCGINPEQFHFLVTNEEMKTWLKNAGVKVPSAAGKKELVQMLLDAKCDIAILDYEKEKLDVYAENNNLTVLNYKTYDLICKMRSMLGLFGYYVGDHCLIENSCVGSVSDLKCRWDIVVPRGTRAPDGVISENGEIWDYKTTASASPELFASSALKYGYWLKMALQSDLYESQFGVRPSRVVLLAQSKTAPYIAQAYELTDQQLDIGREQYLSAKLRLDDCRERNEWAAYGGGVRTLETPSWAANMYGFEDTIKIIEEN